MAAGRWVGRGDKEGGDGAAVDAMRHLINSLPMRGVVVIGEGEKDNAPMLFNGEHVGDWHGGPEVDVAVDPIDGTTLMSKGMPNAIAVLAVAERGAMFDPSRRLLHGEARGRPGLRRRDRHRRRRGREPAPHREGEAHQRLRGHGLHPGPAAPRRAGAGGPADRGPDPLHLRRRHRRRDQRRPGTVRSGRSDGHRRDAGGHRRRPARSSASAGRSRPSCGPATTPSGRRRSPPGTTWTACCTPTTSSRGDNAFFAATGVTSGDLLRGVRYRAGGAYTQSIVMRSKSGTIRVIDSYPPAGEAARLLHGGLRRPLPELAPRARRLVQVGRAEAERRLGGRGVEHARAARTGTRISTNSRTSAWKSPPSRSTASGSGVSRGAGAPASSA